MPDPKFREVKIYDREFPAHEQLLAGDPTRGPWPAEVWAREIHSGEFGVRFKHFQTGTSWGTDGKHLAKQSDEVCRIFGSLEDAKLHSRELTAQHPVLICSIYDNAGEQVTRIHNNKAVTSFALASYLGLLLTAAGLALVGFIAVLPLYWVISRLLPGSPSIASLRWTQWLLLAVAGLLGGILGYWYKIKLTARRRVEKIHAGFKPQEWEYFRQLNSLYGTTDPVERERFHKIRRELEEKAQKAIKS